MIVRRWAHIASCATALGAAGCMVGPDYEPPATDAGDSWHAQLVEGLRVEEDPDLTGWWTLFGDPQLNELVALAGQRNLDLQIASSRIEEARARYGIARADLLPQINALGFVRWTDRPDGRDRISDIVPHNRLVAALDMSWEIDLFGRVRRSMESAEAQVGAALEDWRDVLVTIRAEVATSYITVRTLQLEEALVLEDLASHERTLEVVQLKYASGAATSLDLARAQAAFDSAESRVPGIETRIALALNRISVLIGERPGPLRERLGQPMAVPAPPPEIAIGIPADMIRRRPDIRAAERRLASKTAQIGVAEANLYPRLSINGAIGFEALNFSNWFDSDNFTASIGPTVAWPVFAGGKILDGITVADLQTQQALASYEKTVLRAFEEVENSIISYGGALRTQRLIGAAVEERRRIAELTNERYLAGVDQLDALLRAERLLGDAERELAVATGDVSSTAVRIYKAVGGDWVVPESVEEETISQAQRPGGAQIARQE